MNLDDLRKATFVPDRGGLLTRAGRALQKHGERTVTAFPKPKGNEAALNKTAQDIVDDILTHPSSKIVTRTQGRYGEVIDIIAPDRRGLRFDKNGNFIGFLEP